MCETLRGCRNWQSLPDSFRHLANLRELWLGSRPKENPLIAVPASLRFCTKLETLGLTGCQLPSIPDWIGELAGLRALFLDRNHLTQLPESLLQLHSLDSLSLGLNPLEPELTAAGRKGVDAVRRYCSVLF